MTPGMGDLTPLGFQIAQVCLSWDHHRDTEEG